MSRACAVMVLGCTSGAGKTWLATALCRWYARQGLQVRPFKAQNMSNHARVVAFQPGRPASGLGEIGSAQYFQALAARSEPEPRMNPVLLKPEADTRSQVVLMGQVRADLASMPWRERSALLWPVARTALQSLQAEADLLVIEGAGSPAEINLAANDFVNTFTAQASGAAALIVADIDRGGAFAHLYGTHALMDAQVRRQVRGFVLNKFRGEAALLAPGPAMLQQLTGVPTVGVLPMWREHGLPEEDAVPMAMQAGLRGAAAQVVVLATPHASNLDEFEPLARAGVAVHYSRQAADLLDAPWLVLPGSKNTRADLAWVRAQGMAPLLARRVAEGRPVLAVCGALQWLGGAVADPLGVEGLQPGTETGLGLLPLRTSFSAAKQLKRSAVRLGPLLGAWAPLSGLQVDGYEIHLGVSAPQGEAGSALRALAPDQAGLGWQHGPVLALYLHGLFENPAVVQALFGRRLPALDSVFDGLADQVDRHIGREVLMGLLKPA